MAGISSPPIPSTVVTEQQRQVVVCGGGVIGVCTAFFLAKKGGNKVSVTVVEKSSIASAASGKAGGFLALDWSDGGPLSSLARTSFNLHRSLADELDGFNRYGYRPLKTLSVSVDDQSAQIPWTKKKSQASIPSWIDGRVRNPRTIGTEETTAQVHPGLFTRTIMANAEEKYGVKLVIAEAERVEMEDGKVKAVRIKGEGNQIPADFVVLALGPWSNRLPLLSSLFRVSGLKAHSIVLRPRNPDAITAHALFLNYYGDDGKPLEPELYPRPTGEVYLCGMSEEAEVPDDPEQVIGRDESIRMLRKIAGAVSSELEESKVELVVEQACFLPCTDDGMPIIGEIPGFQGCYVATGHSCWGILNAPATGAAMAELILDGHANSVDLTPFSPLRFC